MMTIDVRSNSSDGIKDTLIVRRFIVRFMQEEHLRRYRLHSPEFGDPSAAH